MDEAGFTEVRRRGKKRKHSTLPVRITSTNILCKEAYSGPEVPKLIQKIATCREKLKKVQFYSDLQDLLASLQLSYLAIVCFGIGHVGTCHIARDQFALLLELMEHYKPHSTRLYDPVLYEEEKTAIRQCGCEIIARNQCCKYSVEVATLFFMPHCGKAMYNNVLWANWSRHQLSQITIVGNSFNSYHEKLTSKELMEEAPYIYHISSASREIPFPTSYSDSTVFNDTSIHLFPLESLATLDEKLWENCPEPTTDHSDPEIIS